MTEKCIICNGELPEKRAHNRKYCTTCKNIHINQKERERYRLSLPLKQKLFCYDCNCELPIETHPNTKYCRDCRIITRQKMQREYGKAAYSKGKKREPNPLYIRPGRKSLSDGLCDICGSYGKLYRDHDNTCCFGIRYGKRCGECERGHLCPTCNTMLGMGKDSTVILRNAAIYLEKYQ